MDYHYILASRAGRVGVLELNRPAQLNALNDALMDELGAALQDFDGDPAIGCILIKGNAKAFAAGADVGAMQDLSYAEVVRSDFITRGVTVSNLTAADLPPAVTDRVIVRLRTR